MKRNQLFPNSFVLPLSISAFFLAVAGYAAGLDRAVALREITDFSRAGMDRRFGPDYASYHPGEATEKFPQIYMPPTKQEKGGRPYQIGGPWTKEAGDFSSTQGQILYVPDNGPGVDRVTIEEWSNGTWSEKPEPPWWGGFRPEPMCKAWQEKAKEDLGQPIAMARGMGSWANCGFGIFSSGWIATAGTCTARGGNPMLKLPRNKVPTAVAVTTKNEFALITVCDTEAKKGQVAVVALSGGGKDTKFNHDWPDVYPCLPNVAFLTDMKLLGYIDLPGMEFPTGVSAVGNHEGGRVNGLDGNAGILRIFDLSKQQYRDMFYKGGNAGYSSTAGFAVVISKHEGKAAFIDLQPLFARAREMFFTTEDNFQKTQDRGPGSNQWPYTFEADPSWKPSVVKVIDVPTPTAVIANLSGGEKARAYIASQDGTVGMYKLGGLATEAAATPEAIERIGEVKMGRNPTCLAYQKYSHDTIIGVSRGDREIAWIKNVKDSLQVTRRLRDARLLDPVCAEVSDTHGIETGLLTVTDFRGRQILNYRFSVVKFATQGGAKFGMGPDGKDEFECGGLMEIPGTPFSVSATNVN